MLKCTVAGDLNLLCINIVSKFARFCSKNYNEKYQNINFYYPFLGLSGQRKRVCTVSGQGQRCGYLG